MNGGLFVLNLLAYFNSSHSKKNETPPVGRAGAESFT
jgi:hypothetical protein